MLHHEWPPFLGNDSRWPPGTCRILSIADHAQVQFRPDIVNFAYATVTLRELIMALGPPELQLVLVGFGNAARRFARLLEERRAELEVEEGLRYRIVGITTGRHGQAFSESGLDMPAALASREAGRSLISGGRPLAESTVRFVQAVCTRSSNLVIIETTPLDVQSGQPAIDHIRTALEGGADVVTANKGPIAFAYHELQALADSRGRSFLFEGTVMDGVPIFNLVRETLPAIHITAIRGVVNSTTNHILTAMEHGQDFRAALTEMQQAGIAEADPSLDVEGWDAAAKIAALSNVLLGARMTPQGVSRRGIAGISREDVERAREQGLRIRLIAEAERKGDLVHARVEPRALDQGSLLARLEGMQNALILRTDLLGEIAITQLEGGLTHTAYALLSDLVRVWRRRR